MKTLFLILALVLLASPASAQGSHESHNDRYVDPDLDGDGDLDIAYALGNDGLLTWYENTSGDGTAWGFHAVDSSEAAFKSAARIALKKAVEEDAAKLRPVILEPIMSVRIVVPQSYMGDVMGDLNRRRGLPQGMDDSPSGKVIRAEVPLAEMFGYATDLRSRTQGRANYSMQFHSYQEVPTAAAQEIVAKVRGE